MRAEDIETGDRDPPRRASGRARGTWISHAVRAEKGDPSLRFRRIHCAAISVRILTGTVVSFRVLKFEKIVLAALLECLR
jgi:hypothetical protein